jgi:putative cardiolipin synthase
MKKLLAATVLVSTIVSGQIFAQETNFDKEVFMAKMENTPHKIRLLNSGLASLEERLQMIERAQKTIDIEYFIYNADKSGKIFTQALIKKAKEGVKIRMLLDTFMIKGLITPFHIHELNKHGIDVKYFNNSAKLSLVKGMYRNHRKLLIVDGKEVLTGGRNIGDEYFDMREDYNFLDREILVEGAIVNKIEKSFDVFWNSEASVTLERPEMPNKDDFKYRDNEGNTSSNYESDLYYWKKSYKTAIDFIGEEDQELYDKVRAVGKKELAASYEGTCNNITFASEYPILSKKNRPHRILKKFLFDQVENAKEKVLFDSPYFIVDEESKKSLDVALNNKIDVQLLTNGLNSTDAIYVYDVFKSIVKEWIGKGLKAFTYKGDLPNNYQILDESVSKARFGVHAKTFVFDNKDVVIGTYNFDPRSANYNSEMVIACNDNAELADEVTKDVELRMQDSFKLDTEEKVDETAFYKVGFLKRIGYGILKIPSHIFDYLL